jgi:hypothetical protein
MRRAIVKRLAIGAAILIAALLIVGGYASYQWNRVVITIQHEGPANEPAADVQLSVRGDRGTVERLLHGDQRDVVVKPEGESGLELHYKLGPGAVPLGRRLRRTVRRLSGPAGNPRLRRCP